MTNTKRQAKLETFANRQEFGRVRIDALTFWCANSGRELIYLENSPAQGTFYDAIEGSFECRWQWDARTLMQDDTYHVSYFCSIGEWASNMTDVLTDLRFDRLWYDSEPGSLVLFRSYTRILLIANELIEDFINIVRLAELSTKRNKQDIHLMLSQNVDIHQLVGFINTVCKHKADENKPNHLHHCNHHLPVVFEDSGQPSPYQRPLGLATLSETDPDSILMPSLRTIIDAVIGCYDVVDNAFLQGTLFADFVRSCGKLLPDE